MSRYQVVDENGKSYGTFKNRPLACQYINNTFPTYKTIIKTTGAISESLNTPMSPGIMYIKEVR